MADYLAGVDVGTTGARCMVFDLRGNPLAGHYCDYGASYPHPGWVEQEPELLIEMTMQACRSAIEESVVEAKVDRAEHTPLVAAMNEPGERESHSSGSCGNVCRGYVEPIGR